MFNKKHSEPCNWYTKLRYYFWIFCLYHWIAHLFRLQGVCALYAASFSMFHIMWYHWYDHMVLVRISIFMLFDECSFARQIQCAIILIKEKEKNSIRERVICGFMIEIINRYWTVECRLYLSLNRDGKDHQELNKMALWKWESAAYISMWLEII